MEMADIFLECKSAKLTILSWAPSKVEINVVNIFEGVLALIDFTWLQPDNWRRRRNSKV
jgi:hypothetical protein